MGKIINFINKCNECKYEKGFSCSNEKFLKKSLEVVRKGRCPYYVERIEKDV